MVIVATATPSSPSAVEARYEEASARYFAAVGELVLALTGRVAEMVCAAFPAAATLHVLGEFGEEFNLTVRAQAIRDSSGTVIAGIARTVGVPDDVAEDFEALADEIDPLLDWLGDLTGDDYVGIQAIDLVISAPSAAAPPTLATDAEARRSRVAKLIERYPLHDPAQFNSPAAELATRGRFLLIEANRYDSTHWFSTHDTLAEAAWYHDNQEYVEDWTVVLAVDLDSGLTYEPTMGTATAWARARS